LDKVNEAIAKITTSISLKVGDVVFVPFENSLQEVKVGESGHMHHFRIVAIETECLIHILKKIGRSADVVFKHYDSVMALKYITNTLDDVALQIIVFGTLYDGEVPQFMSRVNQAFHAVEHCADLIDRRPGCGVLTPVGEDIHIGVWGKGICQQMTNSLTGVVCTIVDEYGYCEFSIHILCFYFLPNKYLLNHGLMHKTFDTRQVNPNTSIA
jgi:hypothetical protein